MHSKSSRMTLLVDSFEFTLDTGRTWNSMSSMNIRALGSVDSLLFASDGSIVLRTVDFGTTWVNITQKLSGKKVVSFLDDGGRLLACVSRDTSAGGGGGILVTTDRGDSWVSGGLTGRSVTSLAAADGYLVAAADGRVYAAHRDAFDWTDVTGSLAATPISEITATTQNCFVLTSDGKVIWKSPMSEIIQQIIPFPSTPTLLAPLQGSAINADTVLLRWQWTGPMTDRYWLEYSVDSVFILKAIDSLLTDTTAVIRNLIKSMEYYWRVRAHNLSGWGPYSSTGRFLRSLTAVNAMPQGIPSDLVLMQNFPNPFNPSTTITYGLPQRVQVLVTVYNTLGETVAEIIDCEMEAGYHSIRFDASGLASGVYIYRIRAGAFVQTRKLLVLR